jgi:DNA-binding CsgD family transcriptional regulator
MTSDARHGGTGRQRAAISETARRCRDADELFAETSRLLQRVVPFDGSLWFGADPTTLLATWPTRVENVADGHCESFWRRELLVEDTNLFRDVSRAVETAVTLLNATDGRPARSARYREFLQPQGYGDELRAAARTNGATWGYISLFRERGRPAFSPAETAVVAEISQVLGFSLRALVRRVRRPAGPRAPGLMVFDVNGTLVSRNDDAEAWLAELNNADGFAVPTAVLAVIAQARAVAADRQHGPARLRLRSRRGQWLVLHASPLRSSIGGTDLVAVVIEPAQSGEIAPIIVQAYQLTPREQEITQLLAQGLGTADIAGRLLISPHTVRDYIKTIFEKTGVRSRGELTAQLFAEHWAASRPVP